MSGNDKIKKRYNRIAPIYDRVELMMERGKMGNWRQQLWKRVAKNISAQDKLLETGVGTGEKYSILS